jgi:hypothetical protein
VTGRAIHFMTRILLCSRRAAATLLFALMTTTPAGAEFTHDSDFSLRIDEQSTEDLRGQYRLRVRPALQLTRHWSLHGFIATGEAFDSAYNTVRANDDQLHLRRLFARVGNDRGKIEIGLIPPYKGRVSSTGLSEEGWLKGARGVLNRRHGALELVIAELDDLDAGNAWEAPETADYFELEYSGRINDRWSFESSIEHMLGDGFVRGELRLAPPGRGAYALELINNLDTAAGKVVISARRSLVLAGRELDWFSYYAYAAREFGPRAELTEDFLDYGNALSTELSGRFMRFDRLEWFTKIELYESRSRLQLGLEIRLD